MKIVTVIYTLIGINLFRWLVEKLDMSLWGAIKFFFCSQNIITNSTFLIRKKSSG